MKSWMSSSCLIGTEVMNSHGLAIGTIRDMIIDVDDGELKFLVISIGESLGVRARHYAIPLIFFEYEEQPDKLCFKLINYDKAELPEIDLKKLPGIYQFLPLDDVYDFLNVINRHQDGQGNGHRSDNHLSQEKGENH